MTGKIDAKSRSGPMSNRPMSRLSAELEDLILSTGHPRPLLPNDQVYWAALV